MSELLTWNPESYLTETGGELMELWVCHVCVCNEGSSYLTTGSVLEMPSSVCIVKIALI